MKATDELQAPDPREPDKKQAHGDGIYFNISQVAKILDVVPATIRNWEKAGLFTAKRRGNNYRIFDFNDIELLKKIKAYSLEENMNMDTIKKILSSQTLTVFHVEKKYSKSIYNDKLKQYRKMNGYTLEDTAKLTGISASYINRIEHGQADVSLDILEKLSTLYGESVLSFFDIESDQKSDVIRNGDGMPMETLHKGVEAKSLTNESDVFQPVLFTVASGCGDFNAHKHFSGYEFIYVISGKLQVTLDLENVYLLKENDSINFSSTRMHSWHNAGKSTLKMLWIHSSL